MGPSRWACTDRTPPGSPVDRLPGRPASWRRGRAWMWQRPRPAGAGAGPAGPAARPPLRSISSCRDMSSICCASTRSSTLVGTATLASGVGNGGTGSADRGMVSSCRLEAATDERTEAGARGGSGGRISSRWPASSSRLDASSRSFRRVTLAPNAFWRAVPTWVRNRESNPASRKLADASSSAGSMPESSPKTLLSRPRRSSRRAGADTVTTGGLGILSSVDSVLGAAPCRGDEGIGTGAGTGSDPGRVVASRGSSQ